MASQIYLQSQNILSRSKNKGKTVLRIFRNSLISFMYQDAQEKDSNSNYSMIVKILKQ